MDYQIRPDFIGLKLSILVREPILVNQILVEIVNLNYNHGMNVDFWSEMFRIESFLMGFEWVFC